MGCSQGEKRKVGLLPLHTHVDVYVHLDTHMCTQTHKEIKLEQNAVSSYLTVSWAICYSRHYCYQFNRIYKPKVMSTKESLKQIF